MNWVSQGYALFRKEPLKFILIFFSAMIVNYVIGFIPIVGFLFTSSILFVGFMKGCHDLDEGRPLTWSHLGYGFSQDVFGLICIYLIQIFLSAVVIVSLLGGFAFIFGFAVFTQIFQSLKSGGPLADSIFMEGFVPAFLFVSLSVIFVAVIFFSFIYAPYLLCFKKKSISDALKESLRASWTHFRALTFFGFQQILLLLLGVVSLGIGLIFTLPILSISFYFSYKEIFMPAFDQTPEAKDPA